MAVLLHPYPQVPGARPVGGGVYYGGALKQRGGDANAIKVMQRLFLPAARLSPLPHTGLRGAEAMLREQAGGLADHGLDVRRFKWWFNYMSWGPGQLERQVCAGKIKEPYPYQCLFSSLIRPFAWD